MSYAYADIDSAVRSNIAAGTIENAIYQIARYIDFLERENPTANSTSANKVQVSHNATTGVVNITATLNYTESVSATGELVPEITSFLSAA